MNASWVASSASARSPSMRNAIANIRSSCRRIKTPKAPPLPSAAFASSSASERSSSRANEAHLGDLARSRFGRQLCDPYQPVTAGLGDLEGLGLLDGLALVDHGEGGLVAGRRLVRDAHFDRHARRAADELHGLDLDGVAEVEHETNAGLPEHLEWILVVLRRPPRCKVAVPCEPRLRGVLPSGPVRIEVFDAVDRQLGASSTRARFGGTFGGILARQEPRCPESDEHDDTDQ